MIKGLTGWWLRGLKRASKAQQNRNKKLIKSLLKPPAKRTKSTTSAAQRKAGKAVPTPGPTTASHGAALPGKWIASYYTYPDQTGALPARRISYWLYLPSTAGPAPMPMPMPMPMVVMLHGCEQTANQLAQGTRMNRLAEAKGFAVLYPQQSLRGHPHRCWRWYEKRTQEGRDDVELIVGVIDQVQQKYPIDRTRIYAAGLSAGASMANIVALHRPDLIAAVGLHSGAVFGAGHSPMGAFSVMQLGSAKLTGPAIRNLVGKSEPFPKMPAILIHGRDDKVVRPVNLAQLTQQFRILNDLPAQDRPPAILKPAKTGKRNRANAYWVQDHYSGRKLLLRSYEIADLGHAWSGGDCTLKFNACAGPDASKMMWDFFARHRRLGLGR